jgi:hypothetical protein
VSNNEKKKKKKKKKKKLDSCRRITEPGLDRARPSIDHRLDPASRLNPRLRFAQCLVALGIACACRGNDPLRTAGVHLDWVSQIGRNKFLPIDYITGVRKKKKSKP